MKKKGKYIEFPVLLAEIDTTGLNRDDPAIHCALVLIKQGEDGEIQICDTYNGFQDTDKEITPEAFTVHGITKAQLHGQRFDMQKISILVTQAKSIVSRSPQFNARKLHALAPECLKKRWYPYPHKIQNWHWQHFPALARMAIMCGHIENENYGRAHPISDLKEIPYSFYEPVFDENGPPDITVNIGRRKVVGQFPKTLLKCVAGDKFRFHGHEGYDFITAYCCSGDADRDRAFRLATTPSNLELTNKFATLKSINGNIYNITIEDD